MRYFTKTLKKLKISFATVLKLYNTLQVWRLEAIKLATSLTVARKEQKKQEFSCNEAELVKNDELQQDLDQEILSPTLKSMNNDGLLNDFNKDSMIQTIEIVDENLNFTDEINSEMYVEI